MTPNMTYTQLCFAACLLLIGPYFGFWAAASMKQHKYRWYIRGFIASCMAWGGWFISGFCAAALYPTYPKSPDESIAILFTIPGLLTGLIGIILLNKFGQNPQEENTSRHWFFHHVWYLSGLLFISFLMYYLGYLSAPPPTGIDGVGVVILFVLGILASPTLLIGYYARKAYLAKNIRQFAVLVAFVVLYLGIPAFYLRLIPGTDWYFERQMMWQLTGTAFTTEELIAQSETTRAFNGDGYSVYVCRLSEKTSEMFRNPKRSFWQFPTKQGTSRTDWELVKWKAGIPTTDEQECIDFALSMAPDNIKEMAKKSLTKSSTYYSYLYSTSNYDNQKHITNVDFYIV